MNLDRRKASLWLMGLICLGIFGLFCYFGISGTNAELVIPTGISSLIMGGLLFAYWRGWKYASHAVVILATFALGFGAPGGTRSGNPPLFVFTPAVLAMLMLESQWLVISAAGTLLVWLVKAYWGGLSVNADPVITYVWTVSGMIFSRFISRNLHRIAQENAHRAENRARELEKKNQAIRFQAELLDRVGQAIVAADANDRVTYVNAAATALYGWQLDQILDHHTLPVVSWSDELEAHITKTLTLEQI